MIRSATLSDIDAIVELAEPMYLESNYTALQYSEVQNRRYLGMIIDHDAGTVILAERDGRLVGVYIGMATPVFFSPDIVATDVIMYVLPEERRGSVGRQLVEAFEAWARSKGAVQIRPGVSIGGNIEAPARLYHACGYQTSGYAFLKNI